MIEITLHGKNSSRTIEIKSPRGNLPNRHVRTRHAQQDMPAPAPKPPPAQRSRDHDHRDGVPLKPTPVPACPILAAFHILQHVIGGDGYFIFDEIFRVVRQKGASITRDILLETLRAYYRNGKIDFRPGYGSQLQFAIREDTP